MRIPPMIVALMLAAPAWAEETPEAVMNERVRTQVPEDWQVRTRWRDRVLITYLMPPIQTSFDLFYDPQRETELVARLCPPADDPLWQSIAPSGDIAIEPTVMGKSGMRISCRATAREAAGS